MAKIVGPGSMNIDITGYTPHLPVDGETVIGTSLKFSPGGKGSNQMTAAHRAGSNVKIIGSIGQDFLSRLIKEHYESEGMSTEYITVNEASETGSAIIEIDGATAQNRIVVVPGANQTVNSAQVYAAEKDFADCDLVLTQFETTNEALITTKKLAEKYGKTFIVNPAPYTELSENFYSGIDYVTPNETEAEMITGIAVNTPEDCKKAAEVLMKMGVKKVVITLGSRGVYFTDGVKEITIPCLKVKAVETTGAGDAFNGGFATAIAEGMDDETALKFATCTAAISVTRYGSCQSTPYRNEIADLLKKEFNISF